MSRKASLYAFTSSIQPARRAWHRAASVALAGTGLSVSLASVLLFAHRLGEGAQQRALAAELGINPAALVRLLDQGEAAGLLMRCDLPGDRRSKLVRLLPPGQALVAQMENALARMRAEILDGVPVEEIEAATRLMRLLEERIADQLGGVA